MTPEVVDPDWSSLLPAVVAIALALTTRQVLASLLGGIWLGVVLLGGFGASFTGTCDLMIKVCADADKLKIVIFTLGMGGMVGVAAASGGTQGIVDLLSRVARTARSSALATWAMGMVVFFDDYASTLLVGNTMRPLTDAARISREKLSYIVDSTAAPIASVAIVSTWIGYEVSLMADAMKAAGFSQNAYEVFLEGIPSRFYPILALLFVGMVSFTGRDFGPMLRAERRARREGKLIADGGSPLTDASLLEESGPRNATPRAEMAIVPVAVLVGTVIAFLAMRGEDASYDALLYASALSGLVGLGMAVLVQALSLQEGIEAYVRGIRSMTMAILVLVLAWGIGKVMSDLKAGEYVASLVGTSLPAWSLPTLTFLLAAVMALCTGSSWGTMAILFPIVIPVVATHGIGPESAALLIGTTSSVLAGAVFGDHCSPISDTTVLSSIASASDHVDHTRTQAPYALVVGAVAILFGTLPGGLGVPAPLLLVVGIFVLWVVLRVVGQRVDAPPVAIETDGQA